MKIFFPSLAFVFVLLTKTTKSKANNLTIVHEDGLCFWLIINGVKKNYHPQSTVKVNNIKEDTISIVIVFSDNRIEHIIKKIQLRGNIHDEKETIIEIKQKSKTKAVISYELGTKRKK